MKDSYVASASVRPEPISDERLAEIRAGLADCTGGEWSPGCLARHEGGCQCAYIFGGDYMGGIGTVYVDNGFRGFAEGLNDCPPEDEARANLKHIALCSPATIQSLLARLDKAESLMLDLRGYIVAHDDISMHSKAVALSERVNSHFDLARSGRTLADATNHNSHVP